MATSSALLFCVAFIFVQVAVGLKCRVDNDDRTQEGFQDVVRACSNVNFHDEEMSRPHRNNNNHNWQRKPQWSQGIPRFPTRDNREGSRKQDDHDDEDSSREMDYNKGGSHRGYHPRTRRAPPPSSPFSQRNNHTASRRRSNASPLEEIEPCIIHCMFRQLQMLDSNNQLDKSAVTSVMTNKLRDPELRDFIRDAISECFEILDSESQDTKCSYTKSFAMCLEQKGQQNCEDWDDEIKKPKQRHTAPNSNKHRG